MGGTPPWFLKPPNMFRLHQRISITCAKSKEAGRSSNDIQWCSLPNCIHIYIITIYYCLLLFTTIYIWWISQLYLIPYKRNGSCTSDQRLIRGPCLPLGILGIGLESVSGVWLWFMRNNKKRSRLIKWKLCWFRICWCWYPKLLYEYMIIYV